jgi:uncharacterized protein (DUF58 family)
MMTQLSDGVPRIEYALASATVLADIATRSGDHVGLLIFDDAVRVWVPPAKGGAAFRRVRDAMIPVETTANASYGWRAAPVLAAFLLAILLSFVVA